ncbi:MAG: PD40 domain-containing protein [Armatimonadetes bacterium]|nr:PD40 domain-containing protein [Armatimonadota bacterium]
MRDPDLYGGEAVFTCEGDLWLGSLHHKTAERLTRHEGREYAAKFSPEGSRIAFSAQYDGADEVYVMPVSGGAPRRLTYRNSLAEPLGWSPDGNSVLVRVRGVLAGFELYKVPAEGGVLEKLPIEFAAHASFGNEGQLAFTRFNRSANAWFHYTGGLQNGIWVGDLKTKSFKEVYRGHGTAEYPVIARNRVWFVEEAKGKFSLKSALLNGREPLKLVEDSPMEIRALQTDGSRLIYERGRGIEIANPETGKLEWVRFDLKSDLMHTRPYRVPASQVVEAPSLGPTGKRVFAASRGQIISLPAGEGEAKVLVAKSGVRYGLPALSPDSRSLAYVGDETGEQQLYVAGADGSNPKQLTKDLSRQIRSLRWSPDSKWIALTDSETRLRLIAADGSTDTTVALGESWDGPEFDFSPDSKWIAVQELDTFTYFHRVVLYEIATGKRSPVIQGLSDDFSPSFSADGKWLAFLSKRVFTPRWDGIQNLMATVLTVRPIVVALRNDTPSPFAPKNEEEEAAAEKKDPPKEDPFRVDFEGIAQRWFEVPTPAGAYSRASFAGDRLCFLSVEESGSTLAYYDLKAKAFGSLGATSAYKVSSDGKKLLVGSGANLQVIDATAKNVDPSSGKVGFGGLQLTIDPVAEWRQIFWDAWRLCRDYFYVKNMHGADWPEVGKKYAQYLPSVRSRDELDELIRWLQAELGISHSFLRTGDRRSLYRANAAGFLGVDLEPDPSGFYRIAKVLSGDAFREADRSPLLGPGLDVKPGSFLIEVSGIPARVGTDWQAGLVGRVGQIVSVKVNSEPKAEGAKVYYVKPMETEQDLRVLSWEQANREYVDKASGGKLGYIHLSSMIARDVADFAKQYYGQRSKESIVLDIRYNTGGNVSDLIATVLKQKPVVLWNQRNAPSFWTRQQDFFPGPIACLVNEFNYSDGEEFPYQFRKLGLGAIIGRRTRGGEVGSDPGWPLVDGGRISVPNYGAWTPDEGWIIESKGVEPDIDVPSDPNAFARGQDPQLDRAIAELLAQLKKNPARRPIQPPDPVKIPPG